MFRLEIRSKNLNLGDLQYLGQNFIFVSYV